MSTDAIDDSFMTTFVQLRGLLEPYEDSLVRVKDEATHYSLDTPHVEKYQRALFFGAAQIMKNYVSYHLMPVYMFPDLLDDVPESLKKRMQGKSCFNFRTLDQEQTEALRALTESGYERLKSEALI